MADTFKKDKLNVKVFASREELGRTAAGEVAATIRALQDERKYINIVFAAAPSQNEFLENLVNEEGIEWQGINGFHMDEYIGLSPGAPQEFGNFLRERIFDRKPFRSVNYIHGQAGSKEKECARYSQLLADNPVDIVCMGIGENGHIAFNDPPVADFKDKERVKVVELDPQCRQQQVNDGCFDSIGQVPTHAFTLTIPALLAGRYLFCMVPGSTKSQVVANTLEKEISERVPSTILRTHPSATLYIDTQSAGLLNV